MGSRILCGHFLQATLCEVERGLFHVTYLADTAVPVLPSYQVGTCAADAKQRIESQAKIYGFETVVWDYPHGVPVLAPDRAAGSGPAV
jgi:hypothetical protein